MIIVTSEQRGIARIRRGRRKKWNSEMRWTRKGTKRRKRRKKIVARELRFLTLNWLSQLIDTIRTPERTNGLLLRSPSYPTHQSSHSSTSQADVIQAIDTSNAFCKLFVVITWLSTPMFCLISHFPLFLLISLIFTRIHLFPVSLGSHERRGHLKKEKKWNKWTKRNKKKNYTQRSVANRYSRKPTPTRVNIDFLLVIWYKAIIVLLWWPRL